MNIFKHEFRMNLTSTITWSLAIIAIIFVFLSIFSGIAEATDVMNEMLAQFPEELLIAFGMDGVDFSNILGLFSLAFVFVQICLAIQAANYGFSLVSVEEREFTADFLLAKPVSRRKILTGKFLSAFTGLTITNLVVWISSFVFINIYRNSKPYDVNALVLLLLSIVVFQLFFLSVGLVISLLVKRVRNVTPFTMGLVFGLYILNAFGDMLGEETLDLITPFKHFDPGYIISNVAYYVPQAYISVALIIISIVASYLLYSRRDIPSAV